MGMIPKAASSPEQHNTVQPAMVQLLNRTPRAQKHIRDVLACATSDSLFTHLHKHNLYSTHMFSSERKYLHILIEIKIQTYCKKLNRAAVRCAVGTLLSVRAEEESKKYSLRGLLPLCTSTVRCQKYSHLFTTHSIEQFSEVQWKTI